MPEGLEKNLKSRKLFDLVFNEGVSAHSKDRSIKAKYYISDKRSVSDLKIAVSVPSKSGNAVWRNRIRRLIYESIRMKKKQLFNLTSEKKIRLLIIFSLNKLNQQNNRIVDLEFINKAVLEILNIIEKRINVL